VIANELRQLLHASPFRPFTVYSNGGIGFRIKHPDFASLSPHGATLIIYHSDDAAFDILDVPLITRVEVHQESAA